jgi:hypothetical protein
MTDELERDFDSKVAVRGSSGSVLSFDSLSGGLYLAAVAVADGYVGRSAAVARDRLELTPPGGLKISGDIALFVS